MGGMHSCVAGVLHLIAKLQELLAVKVSSLSAVAYQLQV